MRMRGLSLMCLVCAGPALADFPETVRDHILPGYQTFADATEALSVSAAQSCQTEDLRPAFNLAYDAWLGVQHLRFGPVEQDGVGLAIAFWPDPKGAGVKAQKALLLGDSAVLEPESFAQQSVAARGLTGLERLLFPKDALPADPCALIRATALDLARTAAQINSGWRLAFADTMLTAGEAGNSTYLSHGEVRQTLFTQVVTGLEFIEDQRLGRPLGTFDAPHPERAEAVASGRSQRNVILSLQALRALVVTLTPDVPKSMAALDHAIALAQAMNDPVLAGVAELQTRLKVEILQQAVLAARDTVLAELGPKLQTDVGFNAADGD